jgi:DNA gyrase subunit A
MLVVKREGTILVATEKGYGKRTDVIQYRTQNRGGKGVLTMRCTDKTGKMVNIMEVVDSDDLIVITNSGVLMRQPVGAIRSIGRVTQGVRLVKLDERQISFFRAAENNTTKNRFCKSTGWP